MLTTVLGNPWSIVECLSRTILTTHILGRSDIVHKAHQHGHGTWTSWNPMLVPKTAERKKGGGGISLAAITLIYDKSGHLRESIN